MKKIIVTMFFALVANVAFAATPAFKCVPTTFQGCSATAELPNGRVRVTFKQPQYGDVAAVVMAEISHAKGQPDFKKALEKALAERRVPVQRVQVIYHR